MDRKGYRCIMERGLTLLVALFSFSLVFSQNIKIEIKAPETVMKGEQFRADYVIESDKEVKEAVIIKNMEGFKILYGPSVSNSVAVSFKGGKRVGVYLSTSTYYLEALKDGKFTLPNAEVKIDGKKYKSGVSKIEVKSPDKLTEDIDAFIKTVASKSRVNVSDTLTLTYKLYTTKEISRIISADFPRTKDFYSTNITPSRQRFTEEEINGRKYKVADLRTLILQPRDFGRMIIPEGQVIVQYSTPTGRKVRDMWGDVYEETVKNEKALKMDSVIIRVQDLKEI